MTLDLTTIDPATIDGLTNEQLRDLAVEFLGAQKDLRRECQIRYYQPVSERALAVHQSTANYVGIGGGNRASKTETAVAEAVTLSTGILPEGMEDIFRPKFRGPLKVRMIVESHTTTLVPTILPKLQWWQWSGVDAPGGERGHWGWIPKQCLINGDWTQSWSEKNRILRLRCFDPDDSTRFVGESTWQFMCLRGDQRVRMADGTWRPVSAVRRGEWVYHAESGKTRVARVFQYPKAPLYRVRCYGREVVATARHKHPLVDGRYVTTLQLHEGDVIRTNRDISTPRAWSLPDWLVGWTAVLIGDGSCKSQSVEFTATPGNRVLRDLPPMPPSCYLHSVAKQPKRWRIHLRGRRNYNPLMRELKADGLYGCGSADKFIPSRFFRLGPMKRAYFLRHLWNTDGTINEKGRQATYITISRQLAYDVKYMLWSIGIPASICEFDGHCGFTGKTIHAYHTTVSGLGFDRFKAAITGKRFQSITATTRIRPGLVRDITRVEDAPVYCLEVEANDHLFVVDGLLTHNSHSQDPSDFASGEFHIVLIDEPTRYAIWRENVARVRSVNGRIILAMTWPDEPGIPVDWIYDEIYEKAQPGPNKDPQYDWFELWTTENPHLDQERVALDLGGASELERRVRFLGQPIRFSNRIHPLFTDTPDHWCFRCKKSITPRYGEDGGSVCDCGSSEIVDFCHVAEFDVGSWPCLFALDPHPRKPHMFCWVAVAPDDDLWVCAEGEVEDDPAMVAAEVQQTESMLGLNTAMRCIDPNMGRQPASAKRDMTWQEEFERAGLNCDLADSSDVGRARVNEYLRPDDRTWRPRLHIHVRCVNVIFQMKRYTWDEHKYAMEKDQKQTPRAKYDDYPSLLRYICNLEPNFRWLYDGAPVVGRMGKRTGAY